MWIPHHLTHVIAGHYAEMYTFLCFKCFNCYFLWILNVAFSCPCMTFNFNSHLPTPPSTEQHRGQEWWQVCHHHLWSHQTDNFLFLWPWVCYSTTLPDINCQYKNAYRMFDFRWHPLPPSLLPVPSQRPVGVGQRWFLRYSGISE